MILQPLLLMTMIPSMPLARLEEVAFTDVTISGGFWSKRQDTNRKVSIPHAIKMCYETPRMQNLIRAGRGERGDFGGLIFDDSDVYKVMESAAYALAKSRDPELERKLDEMIEIVAKAQEPDGYLNSWYTLMAPDRKFTNLADNHELYCAGHLFEAAVAHYQATGKKTLLDVATKFADLLVRTFGSGPGQRMGYPGHPGPELALIKLWRATGKEEYYRLAVFFLESRGSQFFAEEKRTPLDRFDGTYWLDDVPLRDHRTIKGHAVRAAYLLSGATDYANVTGDTSLVAMLDRLWRNTVEKRVFVTGGLGPSGSNEGFTVDYDLPTFSAYQETCASIAMAMWGHRMGLLHGDSRYWDSVERALYNGFVSGVSLQGDTFFYTNPLASRGRHQRVPWFACSCCPTNVTRTAAAVGGYFYAKSKGGLYANLYAQGSVRTRVGDEWADFNVTTGYPWDGSVSFTANEATRLPMSLHLRVPSWAATWKLAVNGRPLDIQPKNGYLSVRRVWNRTDQVRLELPMEVRRIIAHPKAREVAEQAAIQRGPILFCLEQIDQTEPIESLYLPLQAVLRPRFDPRLLTGVVVLEGEAVVGEEPEWSRTLYQPVETGRRTKIRAIPYGFWSNRGQAGMSVWLPYGPKAPVPSGPERSAQVTASFQGGASALDAIRDGKLVEGSRLHPGQLFHYWPRKGTEEWVQYTWKSARAVEAAKVYWFDDTGYGECRPPAGWELQYLDGTTWKPVQTSDAYGTDLDRWIEVKFRPVKTTALRLALKLQPNWSVGIHEWQVVEVDD
jgi:uncharacterized protein